MALGDRPWPVHPRVIWPERRTNRAGEPIKADIREQSIPRDHALDIAAAIRPGAELLDDPRGEAGRRVGQRKGERLRPRPLDPLISGFLLEPRREFAKVSFFLGAGVSRRLLVAAHREKVDVNA